MLAQITKEFLSIRYAGEKFRTCQRNRKISMVSSRDVPAQLRVLLVLISTYLLVLIEDMLDSIRTS